jgi:hypothetical protein
LKTKFVRAEMKFGEQGFDIREIIEQTARLGVKQRRVISG